MDRQTLVQFEALLEAHSASIYRLCYMYLQDKALAEDAMQESFIKAYKAFAQFQSASSPKTWLSRIAINTCKDLRKSAWYRYLYHATPWESLPEQASPVEQREDGELLVSIAKLPHKLKEVILLYYYQDLNGSEIAEILGVSQQAVSARLHRAQKKLKTYLSEEDYGRE